MAQIFALDVCQGQSLFIPAVPPSVIINSSPFILRNMQLGKYVVTLVLVNTRVIAIDRPKSLE